MRILDLGRVVGLSAYELAVQEGYTGTLQEWLESLRYDHSDEYKQFTEKIEAARVEIDADVRTIRQLVEAGLADIARTGETAVSNVNQAKGDALSDIDRLANGARADIEAGVRQIADDTDAALADIEDAGKDALTILTTALGQAMDTISGSGSAWSTQIEQLGLLTKGEIENFVGVKKAEITDHTEDEMDVFDAHAAEKTAEFDEHTADYRPATEQDVIDAEQDAHIASVEQKIGQANIPALERRVTNLEYASKGVLYREETDGATAYTKSVPSGALPYGTLDYLGGRSVVVNQIVKPSSITSRGSIASVGLSLNTDGNGKVTVSGTSANANNLWFVNGTNFVTKDHKYILLSELSSNDYGILFNNGNEYKQGVVFTHNGLTVQLQFWFNSGVNCSCEFHPQLIDLTQMFGVGNEPTTEECQQIFTEYIPYNTGEIVNAEVKSIDSATADGTVVEQKPLPTNLPTLLGINDTVYDYIDFEPVTYKNMKSVDLGTLTYGVQSGSSNTFYCNGITDRVYSSVVNALSSEYYVVPQDVAIASMDDMTIRLSSASATIFVKNSKCTTASEIKQALNGVILHYEATEGGSDYEAKLLHKKCGVYDLSVITDFTLDASGAFWYTTNSSLLKALGIQLGNVACLCETHVKGIQVVNNGTLARFYSDDKTNAPTGLCLYVLATERILDVTDLLADWENSIHVEGGGTITFTQDGLHIPVPNSETYLVKVEV